MQFYKITDPFRSTKQPLGVAKGDALPLLIEMENVRSVIVDVISEKEYEEYKARAGSIRVV